MVELINTKITYVWCTLVVLTGVSWGLGDDYEAATQVEYQWLTIALLLLAFFKVRLVVMHFMEVGTAPIPLRAIFEVWVVVVCAAIVAMYLGYFPVLQ